MDKETLLLGVEGGATKSTALLANDDGRTIKKQTGRALNYHAIGEKRMRNNLRELLTPILTKIKDKKLNAVFGLAGCDTKHDWLVYDKAVKPLLSKNAKYKIVNDAEIALEAKCPGQDCGILTISGTGSNVYGKSGRQTARAVGWDFILGDEGSSYDAGLRAMRTAIRSWDGRIPKSILEKTVPPAAECKDMESFYHKLYKIWHNNPEHIKYFIAAFAPLVDKAILKKDQAAIGIRNDFAFEFVSGISAVVRKLNLDDKAFCLGFVGSGWKIPLLKAMVERSVKKKFPKAHFSKNEENSGVAGAILLARKLS